MRFASDGWLRTITLLPFALVASLALGPVISTPHHPFCHVHQLHPTEILRCFQGAVKLKVVEITH